MPLFPVARLVVAQRANMDRTNIERQPLREATVSDFPRSLIEFKQRFSDEEACAKYLFAARWPQGFVCPGCGKSKAWELQTKSWTWECASCGRQSSVSARCAPTEDNRNYEPFSSM
jgi:predicted RNA-binding Zn-ribbon protein involved in translation (DUF1610 family)